MRLLFIFFGLAILFLVPFFIWGERMESVFSQQAAIDWLRQYGTLAWLAALVLLALDLFLPIPATSIFAALGIVYGPYIGGALGALGSILSGALAYCLCRLLGRGAAEYLLGVKDLRRGEQLFARGGGWLVAFSRWLPVFPEVIACMAGLVRMRMSVFFAALACGSVPLAFVFAYAGHLGAGFPVLTVALSAILPLLLWLVLRPFLRFV